MSWFSPLLSFYLFDNNLYLKIKCSFDWINMRRKTLITAGSFQVWQIQLNLSDGLTIATDAINKLLTVSQSMKHEKAALIKHCLSSISMATRTLLKLNTNMDLSLFYCKWVCNFMNCKGTNKCHISTLCPLTSNVQSPMTQSNLLNALSWNCFGSYRYFSLRDKQLLFAI